MTDNSDVNLGPGKYLLSITLHISCRSVLTGTGLCIKVASNQVKKPKLRLCIFSLLSFSSPSSACSKHYCQFKVLAQVQFSQKEQLLTGLMLVCLSSIDGLGFFCQYLCTCSLLFAHVTFYIYILCEVECILHKSQQSLSSVSKNCSYYIIVLSKQVLCKYLISRVAKE